MIEVLNVQIYLLAIFFAMLSNVFVGMLWYGPLFGKSWIKLVGIKPSELTMDNDTYAKSILIALLGAIGLNSILQYSMQLSGLSNEIINVVVCAAMISLTFSAPPLLNLVIYENRPTKLFLINIFHQFAVYLVMGLVLSIWI